jgi:hypothetical protein
MTELFKFFSKNARKGPGNLISAFYHISLDDLTIQKQKLQNSVYNFHINYMKPTRTM